MMYYITAIIGELEASWHPIHDINWDATQENVYSQVGYP
jgi:hypothetical protein